jgi:RES domain-containing protein
VHVDITEVPNDLVARSAIIPDDVAMQEFRVGDLPRDWREYPAPERLAALGTAWLERGETAVLAVPSVVIPPERNYLINPAHRDFAKISVSSVQPFTFDARVLGRRPMNRP